MGASEGGHCYMFRERVDDCYKRRPVMENDALCHPAGSGRGAQGNDPKNL